MDFDKLPFMVEWFFRDELVANYSKTNYLSRDVLFTIVIYTISLLNPF